MTDSNLATITVTAVELAALDAALSCVHAVLAIQQHVPYGRTPELNRARDALVGLVNRIEDQAAA